MSNGHVRSTDTYSTNAYRIVVYNGTIIQYQNSTIFNDSPSCPTDRVHLRLYVSRRGDGHPTSAPTRRLMG